MQNKTIDSSQKVATWKKNFDDARKLINQARQTIEHTLNDIDASMISGEVDIREHAIDASIWNDIGGFFVTRGMPSDAELLYKRMLDTEIAVENKQKGLLHKGMALYNLGISQINQKNFDEGVPNVLDAFEEDVRQVGERQARFLLAHRLKEGLLVFISSYLDEHFLKTLKQNVGDKDLQGYSSLDLLKILDEPEKFFVCKIVNTKAIARFRTDMYTRVVLFDNLRNVCLLTELVLKKNGTKVTLGGLVPEIFSKLTEKWVDVFKNNVKLTRFDDPQSQLPPIKQFEVNINKVMANAFHPDTGLNHLARIFLGTVLLRNYTSHFFDEYLPLLQDRKKYEKCFEVSMHALLYSLKSTNQLAHQP